LAFPDAGCGDQATEPLAKSAPQWQISAMEIGLRFFMCRLKWWVVALMLLNQALLAGPVVEEKVTHADAVFRVVRATPDQVELVWKDAKGQPYRSFDKVHAALTAQGKTPRFLMNAGLFQEGGIPCGLHVERGMVLHPLNLNEGYGNFHLKLECQSALFLDGNLSQMSVNPAEPVVSNLFGAIFVISD
jgi:uncharacterized protein YigE (DUF2233 family)